MLRKATGMLGMVLIAVAIVGCSLVYSTIHTGPDGRTIDWFGREIVEAPLVMRLIEVDEWRGLWWFAFDGVVFFGCIVLGAYLAVIGLGKRST